MSSTLARRAAPRLALVAALAVGCSEISIDDDPPLGVTLEVDRASAPVGAPFAFRYEAQGDALVGVVLDFGDASADTLDAFGARTASRRVDHAYGSAGAHTATARVVAVTGAERTATVTVEVTAPAAALDTPDEGRVLSPVYPPRRSPSTPRER